MMVLAHRTFSRCGLAVVFALLIAENAMAQRIDKSIEKLMAVLRGRGERQ